MARDLVFFWVADDEGVKRWYMGVVLDRPSPVSNTVEIQPFATRDRKKPVHDAAYVLVWWDPKARKEDWRMVQTRSLHTYFMDVNIGNVMLSGLQWRVGRKLPAEALAILGWHVNVEEAREQEAVAMEVDDLTTVSHQAHVPLNRRRLIRRGPTATEEPPRQTLRVVPDEAVGSVEGEGSRGQEEEKETERLRPETRRGRRRRRSEAEAERPQTETRQSRRRRK